MRWDIFCKVIDNHGDIGVCWRLASQLGTLGHQVRLYVDDASALAWMAPQGHPQVAVHAWAQARDALPGDAVIEAFGCELDEPVQAAIAARTRATGHQPAWINLEYLSAEPWVDRCHGLPSPVMAGPALGLAKRFFYPGFTAATGGLLREPDLAARQAAFDRASWLRAHGVDWQGERLISLFCYEPPGLPAWLAQLASAAEPVRLLVTAGRAAQAVRAALPSLPAASRLAIDWLPLMPQPGYDHLLWACDANFVRGEDSFVRALWAGRPFVWNPYPQADGVHLAKLDAFLDWLQAPAGLREFHHAWNQPHHALPRADFDAWRQCVTGARDRAQAMPDLASQLTGFAAGG
ncbi:elongation factor P maturation arginine rhamnosyltransferase EarP [Ramlibacter humi]|uniref:Protein-arginine rhamnosyltransferase n=1 Tax=Ramlibacter humi TaxID=2530451 RepID=A0A4Z0CDT0_9BURK|nr:elongation factor P maturation arginine rhamnosyltransferase EarP [Ramlibacter humi]TFZ08660.1 elongation factor P maturation arginine rhamnosyltransferase EarP [Ramlibacter humi]